VNLNHIEVAGDGHRFDFAGRRLHEHTDLFNLVWNTFQPAGGLFRAHVAFGPRPENEADGIGP
jgi:hypothetical protein